MRKKTFKSALKRFLTSNNFIQLRSTLNTEIVKNRITQLQSIKGGDKEQLTIGIITTKPNYRPKTGKIIKDHI